MEDHAIKELEDIAVAYADIRDHRIDLNREEASLKDHARRLMHKYNKSIYKHGGVEIRLTPGVEDVKVKVRAAGDEQPDEPAAPVEQDPSTVEFPEGDE